MDGTLLYTLEDLQKALNNVFFAHNYPLKTIEEVRVSVGNGVGKLLERLLPAGMENQNRKLTLNKIGDLQK